MDSKKVRVATFCGFSMVMVLLSGAAAAATGDETAPARDPKQAVDEGYTAKIQKYTTAPYFTSPLVNYLPASSAVPTPETVLGDVAGAPGVLPYAEDVYKYMRMLEKASPRVKVFSIGTTEEGREMIAVAVSSPENLKNIEENRARPGNTGYVMDLFHNGTREAPFGTGSQSTNYS